MQRTKSKILSILLILAMLLTLLPTTALAADYPGPTYVSVDGGKSFTADKLYFRNGEAQCSADSANYNAYYDPTAGTLTLNGYDGGAIVLGGAEQGDLTIKLMGNNTIRSTTSQHGVAGNTASGSITITADSSSETLTIDVSNSTGYVYGIDGNHRSVTISGSADVTIIAEAKSTDKLCFGINSLDTVSILGNASVDIKSKVPENNTGSNFCRGINGKKVAIETDGTIMIDVTAAGDAGADSYGVDTTSSTILTKVGEMQVKWKKGTFPYVGGAISRGDSFDINTHAVNVDKDNCFASYRFGTPRTVTVENGTFTGPGVPNATKYSGKFLEGDTVSITPSEKNSSDGTLIPFKEWTAEGVMFDSSAATANNSFTVPGEDVTVTAKHDPFDGAPSFTPTGTTNTEGTLTFKTKVKPGDGSEYFRLVKDGDQNDESKYIRLRNLNPSTSTIPYEYSYGTTSSSGINQVEAGDYYVAEKLNGTYYWSEKFTVSYTAAPTPTASVGDVTITGTTGTAITDKEVIITLANDTFAPTLSGNWITNLPTGLSQSVSRTDDTHAKITVSGTPTATSSDALVIKIPAANLVSSADLTVTSNANAKFAITAPLTAIAVPTANTGLVYDGTEKTGVTESAGYTLTGTYKATDVGTADYTATATLNPGYKWDDDSTGVKTITWNIGKRTPTAADFNFAPPAVSTYDGNNKTASVTLKSPLTKSGTITPTYMKGGSVVTETKDVGDYTVKIDVVGGDNFNAGSGLTAPAWTFSITPAEWGTPTETLTPVNPTTVSGSDGQITGTTSAMQYKKSTESGWTDCSGDVTGLTAGTYYVRYKADSNHTASDTNYKSVTLTDPGTTLYGVTVTDGTAAPTGDQAAGAEVTITANTKTGFNFKEWTGLNDSDYKTGFTKASNPATFTMPASNVNVTATYDPAALTGTASITGTLKFNEELTASLAGTNNTGTLTYKWYRSGEATEIATNTTGKYTLVAADIGKTITVEITSSVQTGKITSAATATVDKADGPAAPSVTSVACTNSSNNDGKITGVNTTMEYSTVSDFATKTACTSTEITGLVNGTYYVRVAETTTHKAGTAATVTVPAYTPGAPTEYTITFDVNGGSGTIPSQTTSGKKLSSLPTATHSGSYSFAGWYTAASGGAQITTAYTFSADTTVYAHWTYTGGGGGGGSSSGGGSYSPSYSITPGKSENGSITVSPKSARKGDTVTITVTPDKGYELEDLTVLDNKGKELALTEKNGKYSFKMPAGKVEVKATFIKEAEISPFDDVSTNAYYYEAVKWAQEKGITGGIGNGLFAPNQPCTRAQIVTFLWRAAGSPAPKNMSSFTDVPADAFYAKAVAWAVENGITGGTGDGKFSPDATCTRAQSVTFLYRAAGSPKVSGSAEFGDVATNAYYADAVAWAAKNGITGGISGGLFGSGSDCTRAQIVTFLYRNYQSK